MDKTANEWINEEARGGRKRDSIQHWIETKVKNQVKGTSSQSGPNTCINNA